MARPCFNYIVTIHNKEELLDRVLAGIAESAGVDARIVAVLDGCVDGSEQIARRFAAQSKIETRIVLAPDVHEIKSLNLGLRETKPGYCVLVQDDVILQEPELERLVQELCEEHDRKLGYVSFRLAADLRQTGLLRRLRGSVRGGRQAILPMIEECNLIGGPREMLDVVKAAGHQFHVRSVGIKSPVCLTPELRIGEPYLDEDLAPYCYDDVDLSLRSLKRGLTNGLFPIRFLSDAAWSGTLKDPDFSARKGADIRLRNRHLIWRKHGAFLKKLWTERREEAC
ncbi:MAG: glycosyltransferase [Acidobacteriota bacterium]|nr:glycosyltransferase [Acidobacteriota bacterium]